MPYPLEGFFSEETLIGRKRQKDPYFSYGDERRFGNKSHTQAWIAQLVEQTFCKCQVMGSNPIPGSDGCKGCALAIHRMRQIQQY